MRWRRKKPLTREQIRARLENLTSTDLFIFVESAMMSAGEAMSTGRSAGSADRHSAGLDQARELLEQAIVGLELMEDRANQTV